MGLNLSDRNIAGKDVLLVVPPPFFTRMPPLGPSYLTTYLKEHGYAVELFDLNVLLFNMSSGPIKELWSPECTNLFFQSEIADNIGNAFKGEISDFVEWVISSDVRVIAFSVNMISIYLANSLAERIKARDKSRVIVFGGPATYFKHPRELITPGFVDYFVIGEGEAVFLSLVRRLKKGEDIHLEPGILPAHRVGNCLPAPAVLCGNLDLLPHPTYEELDLSAYNTGSDYKPLPLLLSRGCINRCSYCIDHIMWPKYRVRTAQHAFREIEYHCRVNKTLAFEWNDLLCNGNLRVLESLCDLIIASRLEFSWVSYAVIRSDMTSRLCEKLKKAGCHTLIYGMEHSSKEILKGMKKGYTSAQAQKVLRMTHQAGICTNVNIIVGFPGEIQADLDALAVFLDQNKDYISEVTNISGFTLFPHSYIGQNDKRYGLSWDKESDPMLFKDTNGLDYHGRLARVAKFCKIVEDMGLRSSIINRPKLNPLVKDDASPAGCNNC